MAGRTMEQQIKIKQASRRSDDLEAHIQHSTINRDSVILPKNFTQMFQVEFCHKLGMVSLDFINMYGFIYLS